MSISKDKWERVKNYYEAGLTLSQIKERTGVDRSTISKKAKNQQWQHGTNSDYIEAREIIADKKSTKNQQAIQVLDELADERINRRIFFEKSALQNQQYSNKVMKKDSGSINTLEAHSRITQRNKETVLGKDKTVEIHNTNAQQNITEVKIVDA